MRIKFDNQEIHSKESAPISALMKQQGLSTYSPVQAPTRTNYYYRYADFGQNVLSSVKTENAYMRDSRQLVEVDMAIYHDSYVMRSVEEHMNLMLNVSEYNIISENPRLLKYVDQRFDATMTTMGTTRTLWFRKLAEHLIKYHNIIIVKSRVSSDRAKLRGYKLHNNMITVGYHIVHPASIMPQFDTKRGNKIVKWSHGGEKIDVSRVIHISVSPDNVEGVFGLPYIMAASLDVKMMRELEELDYSMIWRHINPLLLFKIGSEKHEMARGTPSEVADVRSNIDRMPANGWVVGTERWNVEPVNMTIGVPDIIDHLQYFRNRAITGLRLDPITLGLQPGGSEGTMYNLEKKRFAQVKAYQSVIKTLVEDIILKEWMLDIGVIEDNPPVQFQWKEVDFDNKIKQENHYTQLFSMGAISHGELRRLLGKKQDSPFNKQYIWEIQNKFNVDLESAKATLSNATMPANQAKKKASPTKGRK